MNVKTFDKLEKMYNYFRLVNYYAFILLKANFILKYELNFCEHRNLCRNTVY